MEGAAPKDAWTVWEYPGKPVRVRLSPNLLRRLAMVVRQGPQSPTQRALETGGLLIGSRTETDDPAVIQVYDFEPVKSEYASGPSYLLSDRDRLLLTARIAAHEATCKNSSIVGVYRTHTRPDFAITAEDATLFSTYFKNPSDVFLLIKPNNDGSATAGFIIREEGEVVSNTPYVQFPLERTVGPQAVPEPPLRKTEERPPVVPVVPQRIFPSPALRRAADRATFWLPAVGVLALTVGLYWGLPSRVPDSSPVKPVPPPALSVAFSGDGLRLSWDRRIVKRADRAVLWIKDGAETLRTELDSKQLNDGSVIYRANHSDVEFRLETLSPAGSTTESVRAIGGPTQVVVAPPQAATAAVDPPRVSPEAPKTLRRTRTRTPDSVSKPDPRRPNTVGTASRQASTSFELARAEHTPAPASTIPLPDAPAVQPVVAPPSSSSKEFLSLIGSADRPVAADLPFRVSVEPVPATRRGLPLFGRSQRADYVPPATLRNPGLAGPLHRSVAGKVNIDVKVYVNPAGKVDYSEVLSKVSESNRELAALAVFSARRWEFTPARTKDGAVPGEVIIHYQFGPGTPEGGNLAGR